MHRSSVKPTKSSKKSRSPHGSRDTLEDANSTSLRKLKKLLPISSHQSSTNILTLPSRLFAARKKATPEPVVTNKTKSKSTPKETKATSTSKTTTTKKSTASSTTTPKSTSPTTKRGSKKAVLETPPIIPEISDVDVNVNAVKKTTKKLSAKVQEVVNQEAIDNIGKKIKQSLSKKAPVHTPPVNIDINNIDFNPEELDAIKPDDQDGEVVITSQPTARELHYQTLQKRALKKKQDLDRRQLDALSSQQGQPDQQQQQRQQHDEMVQYQDDFQHHYQESIPTEIDLDGAFEELNRYLHSNGTQNHGQNNVTTRLRKRKGLGVQTYDLDDSSGMEQTESDQFYSQSESYSEDHRNNTDGFDQQPLQKHHIDVIDENGNYHSLSAKQRKKYKQHQTDSDSTEHRRPEDSGDELALDLSADGNDSEEERLDGLIFDDHGSDDDEGNETSEFTTSEGIHTDSTSKQSTTPPDQSQGGTDGHSNHTTQHKHPTQHPISSSSSRNQSNNDDNHGSANGFSSNSNNSSSSDPFGTGGNDRQSIGGGGKKEKNWPRFNQDIYNRLYAPNASISPKLSSCLVLPLAHTMRPLFPGLYCPVTVRDPAIVTEILKQTYKGFPYIGVFLKKSKNKSDIFNPTDPKSSNSTSPDGVSSGTSKTTIPNDESAIDTNDIDPDNLHTVGTFAHIFNITNLPGGGIHMLLVGLRRIELDSLKCGLVPNLGQRGVNALISSTMPGQGGQGSGVSKMNHYGSNNNSNNQDLDSSGLPHHSSSKDRNKRRGVADGADSISRNNNNRDVDSPVTSQELSPQEVLEQVMNFDTTQYHEFTNPEVPLPKNLKRVLIGNITHHDETSVHTTTTNEDGSLKTPLELSRQEEIYKVYTVEILSAAKELLQQSSPGILEQLQYLHSSFDFSNPVFVADFISNLTNASSEQMQQLLSTLDVTKRMHLTLLMIKREVEMTRFHTNIQNSVEESLKKTQREFYLKQQLTQIKKELGMEKGDDKQTLSNKFKSRVKDRWDFIPQYAKTVIEDELSKLETLDQSSSEYNVTRNYLDWLTILPWQHSTDEIYDIKHTEMTLNEEHYGMQDVKDRILEFVAVGKLLQKQKEAMAKKKADEEQLEKEAQQQLLQRQQQQQSNDNGQDDNNGDGFTSLDLSSSPEFIIPINKKDKKFNNDKNDDPTTKKSPFSSDQFTPKESKEKHQASTGKIMLFVGPPGIGKTSIGKSIAKSLNREFYRFSVGGLTDVSEIKGHRRTYVGALPGKIVQALKKTQCSNPVILIDEIDKIGRGGNHGDPSSALLEVLDPEQNGTFTDHYMDISIDLSKVLFICTANKLHEISGPLRDRMDVVELSGYIQQEKEHIAKHYLEPQLLTRCGLERHEAEITPATISHLVKWYCREAGVRTLQKYMEMILRKVAFRVVRNDPLPIRVTVENLSEYIGQELYQSDRMYDRTPVGVVAGLAWSAAGGSTMYIESAVSRTIFNRKMWGLPPLKNKKGHVDDNTDNNINDSVTMTEIHGTNQIHTTVDVATNDTQIIIETNDKPVAKPLADGLAPSHPSLHKKKKKNINNKNKKSNNKNNKNTDNGIDDNNGGDDDGDDDDDDDDDDKADTQGTGSLKLTGSLGEVMKESASIAYTLAKHYLHKMATDVETQRNYNILARYGPNHNEDYTSMSPEQQALIDDQINLSIQDDPIDPLNCKIPILRPPISNTTSTASKIANTNLNHKQSQLQQEMETKLKELATLQQEFEKCAQLVADEDELFATEVQPIIHENPQRTLKPGDIYTTPKTMSIKEQFIPVNDPNFFNTAHIHIHAPQGATPKDGPSAGIALVSVLMSQALQRPLVNNIAMTGEVSLTGKVLPIGGLREKIIGARQSNIYHLIVPKANMHDIADLPSFITSGLTIYFAETCDQVLRIVFGSPYSLGGKDANPTLIKKYDTFDGDSELEILKMQSEEAIAAAKDRKKNEGNNNTNTNDSSSSQDGADGTNIPKATITDAEIISPTPYPTPGSHEFMRYEV